LWDATVASEGWMLTGETVGNLQGFVQHALSNGALPRLAGVGSRVATLR
jgi:hypothetical protein